MYLQILKKIGALPNPQKRFRPYEKVSKHVHGFKNTIKKSTKPLKDRLVYRWEDPSPKPLPTLEDPPILEDLSRQKFEIHITRPGSSNIT